MLHGFNFSKCVFLSTLDFKFLRIQMPVMLSFFNTWDLYPSDVTSSRSCHPGEITKMDWKITMDL